MKDLRDISLICVDQMHAITTPSIPTHFFHMVAAEYTSIANLPQRISHQTIKRHVLSAISNRRQTRHLDGIERESETKMQLNQFLDDFIYHLDVLQKRANEPIETRRARLAQQEEQEAHLRYLTERWGEKRFNIFLVKSFTFIVY